MEAPTIYIMNHFRVIVGRKISQEGPFVILGDCACVRRWGTSKGLGQLAAEGPQRETITFSLQSGVTGKKKTAATSS